MGILSKFSLKGKVGVVTGGSGLYGRLSLREKQEKF